MFFKIKRHIIQRIVYGIIAAVAILISINQSRSINHSIFLTWILVTIVVLLILQMIILKKWIWSVFLLSWTIYTMYSVWYFIGNMVNNITSTVKYSFVEVISQFTLFVILCVVSWTLLLFLKPLPYKKNQNQQNKNDTNMNDYQ